MRRSSVPCGRFGIRPCIVGEYPAQLAALNQTNLNVQELAVQGFLHWDISLNAMVTEMFESQAGWLPQFTR